jgi:multiple sugar transport system substrate-binding protein
MHIAAFTLVLVMMLISLPAPDGTLAQGGQDMGVELNADVSGDVEFWHFWGSPVRRTAVRRIVAMCEQALPNINVEEVFKPFGDIWTANIAAVAAGSGMPDVIVEDRPQLPRIAADGIEQNLQPLIEQDGFDSARFWPFTWEQTLYEGESYGIPFETDVRVLFYNKTLFEQAGLDPDDPPETWEELWAYADQLDRQNEDGSYDRFAFFPLIGNVGPDLWAQTNGHIWVQDGRPVLDDPAVAETLDWIRQWIERYGGWEAIQEFRAQFAAPPNDHFMSGKVAMFVDIGGYNSILSFYRPSVTLDDGSQTGIQWGAAPIPYNVQPSSVSGGFALSIPTGAENPEAAWEFIKCATSPAAQVSWARDTYAMPSDQQAAQDPILMADPVWEFFVQAMETSTSGEFVSGYSNWKEQLDQRYDAVWQGDTDPAEALQDAQAAVDETIEANQ